MTHKQPKASRQADARQGYGGSDLQTGKKILVKIRKIAASLTSTFKVCHGVLLYRQIWFCLFNRDSLPFLTPLDTIELTFLEIKTNSVNLSTIAKCQPRLSFASTT